MALNVLVVDDSAVMRSMIIRTLRLSGVPLGEIHEAPNGLEGLQALGQEWIDLALVDINMPVMDGEEMIDRVRQDPMMVNLPVIVVSTESSEARIRLLQRKGARFVHKPFTPESLRATIKEVTGVSDEHDSGEGVAAGIGCDF